MCASTVRALRRCTAQVTTIYCDSASDTPDCMTATWPGKLFLNDTATKSIFGSFGKLDRKIKGVIIRSAGRSPRATPGGAGTRPLTARIYLLILYIGRCCL